MIMHFLYLHIVYSEKIDRLHTEYFGFESFSLNHVILELRFLYSRGIIISEQIEDEKKSSTLKKHRLNCKRKQHKKNQNVLPCGYIWEYL